MGEVLLLEAVNPLLPNSAFVAFAVGTITLGARCNEMILLVARYEIRAARSVDCLFVPPNLYDVAAP